MMTLLTVIELMGTVIMGMLIGFDIITSAKMRASLVKIPVRINRSRR